MRKERQRAILAEACGWKFYPIREHDESLPYYLQMKDDAIMNWVRPGKNPWQHEELPDYLNDLNAIHDAESKLLDGNKIIDYDRMLKSVDTGARTCDFSPHMADYNWHTSASLRTEALLRVLNLWEE